MNQNFISIIKYNSLHHAYGKKRSSVSRTHALRVPYNSHKFKEQALQILRISIHGQRASGPLPLARATKSDNPLTHPTKRSINNTVATGRYFSIIRKITFSRFG